MNVVQAFDLDVVFRQLWRYEANCKSLLCDVWRLLENALHPCEVSHPWRQFRSTLISDC